MQEKLFYEDEFEALNLMVSHSAKTPQQLAGFLFPHMKPASAYARLKACLNPEGDQRLTFGQILAAMKFCECYDPLMFACDETMHARPDRKAPQDEEVKIVEAMNNAAEVMTRAMRQLENLRNSNITQLRAR
ncbi:MAG: hypothetical protein M0P19_08900 [Nevskia sp.]|jgi:hypothetical protein|nr:hypothetical protein [Nevskia sp.]MCK9386048.1 hypothetical protein [Nevskia sp.]MCK9386097.1 hypothetical protein [Nevskia sp.]MCK9386150.1 hypothetical protein [Nevskia sp.]